MGVPCLPPNFRGYFPISPSTCVPLAYVLFALGQILICGPEFICLGGVGVGRFCLNNRLSPKLPAMELIGSHTLGRDNWDSALSR